MSPSFLLQVPGQQPGGPADWGGVNEQGDQKDQRHREEAGEEAGEGGADHFNFPEIFTHNQLGGAHHLLERNQDGDRCHWRTQP